MNNTKKIALAAAILCSTSATALAQEINPSWYVQPSVVGIKTDDRFGVDDKDWGGGLKFGKPVHPLWDIQFGGSQVNTKENGASYRQTLLGVDALLMLSRKQIRPFILFGVGAQRDKVGNPMVNHTETSPYASVGLGVQADLTPQWSMQADIRTVRGFLRDDEIFGFDRSNNNYLTIGFNYAFSPPPSRPAPAPEPAPAPVVEAPQPEPVAPPPPAPRFEKVTLSATELFAFDSAKLNGPQPKLDTIAEALQADPSITNVDITGYADRLGSQKYNLKLSEQRANAVRDYLTGKGIDAGRLNAYGKGEANPVVTCDDVKKKAELIKCLEPNRRVEVEQITIERRVE